MKKVTKMIEQDRKYAKFHYGSIYTKDIPEFLANGKQATPEMHRVEFGTKSRVGLIPMELIPALKSEPIIAALV